MLKFLPGYPAAVTLRLILLVTAMTFSPAAFPTEWDEASSAQLTVAVAECPPFVIIENGQYSGLAVFYLLEHRINKKLFSSNSLMGRILEPLIIGLMFVTSGPIRFYRFKTLTARVLSTVLTLSSTFLIASITAVLASSFTLNAMQAEWRDKNLEYLGK